MLPFTRRYRGWISPQAKTACTLLAVEATRRWTRDGIYANALNPGAIAINLQKHTGGLKAPPERRKTVQQGAATSVLLAASPLLSCIGGRYFEDCNEARTVVDVLLSSVALRLMPLIRLRLNVFGSWRSNS